MAEKKAQKNENRGSLAARAWNESKLEEDLEFDMIPNVEYRQQLEHRAERAKATGLGTTNFEKKVIELAAADKAAGVDEGPMALTGDSPAGLDAASDAPMAVAAEEPAKTPAKRSSKGTKSAKGSTAKKSAAKSKSSKAVRKLDQSGHVPKGDEAAATVKSAKTAPQNP